MTREEIIAMAREAGLEWDLVDEDEGQIWYITADCLERFAYLVAAAEREAIVAKCINTLEFHGFDDAVPYIQWMAANKLGVKELK